MHSTYSSDNDNKDFKRQFVESLDFKKKLNHIAEKRIYNQNDDIDHNIKLTFKGINTNNIALQIVLSSIKIDTAILFTTKKMKIKIDNLSGSINVSKGKDVYFSLDTIENENPFIPNKKPKMYLHGTINILNIESGHIYKGMIVFDDETKYIISNRPCVPMGIEFEGYFQINVCISCTCAL